MSLDQEKIQKRLSQIEIDINQMNQMIDDNLLVNEEQQQEQQQEVEESTAEDDGGDLKNEEKTGVDESIPNEEITSETTDNAPAGDAIKKLDENNSDNWESVDENEDSIEVTTQEADIKEDHVEHEKEIENEQGSIVEAEIASETNNLKSIKEKTAMETTIEPQVLVISPNEEQKLTQRFDNIDISPASATDSIDRVFEETKMEFQRIKLENEKIIEENGEVDSTEHEEPSKEEIEIEIKESIKEEIVVKEVEANTIEDEVSSPRHEEPIVKNETEEVQVPEFDNEIKPGTVEEQSIDVEDLADEEILKTALEDNPIDTQIGTLESPENIESEKSTGNSMDMSNDSNIDNEVSDDTSSSIDTAKLEQTVLKGEIDRTISPIEPPSQIFVAKSNMKGSVNDKQGTRRSTNPFRVVSVSGSSSPRSNPSSRHASGSSNNEPRRIPSTESTSSVNSIEKLQSRQDYLIMKCSKLQKEINYLKNMNTQGMLSIEDSRKLNSAIQKLQDYLDRKTKEKYEVGLSLSRQLRKGVDRGENAQFWVSNK
ncbi:hypothetical protein Kpol_1051p34 [Vanderwaltozyma polyspora DSM 70294]|uniref:Bud neck protein 5 n=1 Tax=Vanderwaltozyma polyspora (strain ATCC 22028 / DSM 70294 / BCRC 21397 / CBS 2163 / NBRC 10782 / NRRL Y-8283 / UCD 57-17) TaxID=436907 RepID=A7TMZ6_VANPO|nr:uncharacterized protein Kpol_1051p34 [Vanderwaltozyma polyspora DSM 70294]EDO16384.1 hypothetical protein Kpol_1051p34 [Vanderwaltozyma polyspora DSM 70294]